MSQQEFSEEQKNKIKQMIYDALHYDIKQRTLIIGGLERAIFQRIDNIEATQRIIVEKLGGNRNLIEHNYNAILQNREDILKNREEIITNRNILNTRFNLLEEKLDKISEKIDAIP